MHTGNGPRLPREDMIIQQQGSGVMRLPRELRDEIYAYVFSSTRLAFGEWENTVTGRIRLVSRYRGTSPALLRTCHRIRDEVGDSWLGQVVFHFEDPRTLLDKLTSIPTSTLRRIRHLRVSGSLLEVACGRYDRWWYDLQSTLRLLPGLKLDVLTVFGPQNDSRSLETVDNLIQYSNGWRELRYISHNPVFLNRGWDRDPEMIKAKIQHELHHWQTTIEARDGMESRPYVSLFQSKEVSCPGAVLQHDSRVQFLLETTNSDWGCKTTQFPARTDSQDFAREVLLVVQRGRSMDFAQRTRSEDVTCPRVRYQPGLPSSADGYAGPKDMITDFMINNRVSTPLENRPNRIWQKIVAWESANKDTYGGRKNHDRNSDRGQEAPLVRRDTYLSVDDYIWGPPEWMYCSKAVQEVYVSKERYNAIMTERFLRGTNT